MSKAPETIYIPDDRTRLAAYAQRMSGSDVRYVIWTVANSYAIEAEKLRATLTQISRNASVMTAHQIETMARDALTNEG